MNALILVLRLVHILGGIMWVGAVVFTSFFLLPAMRDAGPAAAGAVMGALQRRKFMVFMPIVALCTIVSGFWLFMIVGGDDLGAFARSPMGQTLSGAAGLAVIGLFAGLIVIRPAAEAAAKLAQRIPSAAEGERPALQQQMQSLQRRTATASTIVTAMLIVAAIGMAVARYVG